MNFWTLLVIALGVLWAQANVIFCASLFALRAEARVRWEALLLLEKHLLECQKRARLVFSHEIKRWNAVLEAGLLPENGGAVLEFYGLRRLVRTQTTLGAFAELELRCLQANLCYVDAAVQYNRRIHNRLGWPLSKWIGFAPVQEPPEPSLCGSDSMSGDRE